MPSLSSSCCRGGTPARLRFMPSLFISTLALFSFLFSFYSVSAAASALCALKRCLVPLRPCPWTATPSKVRF